jgi:hypothetical protein
MNADEAKKLATANRNRAIEAQEQKKNKIHDDNVNLLKKHFLEHIKAAVLEGKMFLDKVSFPSDRFSTEVISEVVESLRASKYEVQKTEHTAYQKTEFRISWR